MASAPLHWQLPSCATAVGVHAIASERGLPPSVTRPLSSHRRSSRVQISIFQAIHVTVLQTYLRLTTPTDSPLSHIPWSLLTPPTNLLTASAPHASHHVPLCRPQSRSRTSSLHHRTTAIATSTPSWPLVSYRRSFITHHSLRHLAQHSTPGLDSFCLRTLAAHNVPARPRT
ncbi:hypothetical protein L226DRAFT_72587 [Lentinus tigrinus ALCF2SS1-7]|uniref:Uncharacterized protein n=1 Tax=Lentinus tigrinus ALCF2SS1-6 TaxID=1328759 RepID=A0A5C2SDM4_9APHY|nr:hypothetical protein L227DRAFT_42682 [Lentinus tigrinus ALCF2SS1-6]RPD74379.1 hypothetical protein L226DRAFT_72587 [Lentinus tigrinus ALCF2SS1-7]